MVSSSFLLGKLLRSVLHVECSNTKMNATLVWWHLRIVAVDRETHCRQLHWNSITSFFLLPSLLFILVPNISPQIFGFLNPYYNCNNTCNMQLATMQLFACSMQLATKAITTAIKLDTLQENGRVPPAQWLSVTDQLRHVSHFLFLWNFQRISKK